MATTADLASARIKNFGAVGFIQRAKYLLVRLGPRNPITKLALRLATRGSGVSLKFGPQTICLAKNGDTLIVRSKDLSLIPEMVRLHGHYFSTLVVESDSGSRVLDFSSPSKHRYRRTGIEIRSPHVPEDDSIPMYTRQFMPREGMTVFDVGAHAGLTAIEFSRMVGPSGRVFAFEPDDQTRSFLLENLAQIGAKNITVLDFAIGEASGRAKFSMDGTQAAGLIDTLVYRQENMVREVPVRSLADACRELDVIPHFLKSDIEGGELGMIRGATGFLREHPIQMAFETHRLPDGSDTSASLKPLLTESGYVVERLCEGGQNFMFATPRSQIAKQRNAMIDQG